MKNIIYILTTLIISLLLSNNLQAQTKTGTVSGIIRNNDGIILPNLSVKIKNTKIGSISDENGFYQIQHIPVGNYVLEVSGVGYETVQEKTQILDNQTITQNFTLNTANILLNETQIKAYRALNGVGQMGDVQNEIIFAGKKNEVLVIDSLNANTALNVTRQILGKIPGFNVSETEGSGFPSNGISFRGLNPVQSVEMNTRQNGYNIAADIYGYPETYYMPAMEAIERVEVIRGAGTLQFGPQFGGVVNYKIKDGSPEKPFELTTQQTTGSFGLFNSYTSAAGTQGKFKYFSYLQYRRSEGWRANSTLSQVSGFGKISYQANSKLKFGLEYSILRNKIQMSGGLSDEQWALNPQASYRARNWLTSPWNILTASAEYRISPQSFLTIKSAYLNSSRDLVWRNEDGGPSALDNIDSTTYQYVHREVEHEKFESLTTEARILTNYNLGKTQNTLASGIRFYTGKMKRQGGGVGTTSSDMDFTLTEPNFEYDLDFTTTNFAPFLENIFRINEKLSITPGVRFEFINSTIKGKQGFDEGDVFVDKSKNRYIFLTGIGLQYKGTETTNFYVNYSEAYRPIEYSALTPFGVSSKIDPNLKDSKGFNADFGWRGTFRNYLNFDIGAFYLSYENRIGIITQKDAEGNDFTLRTNVANSVHKGIESYVDFGITKFFAPHSKLGFLSIFNSFAFVDAKYTTGEFSGNVVEYAPNIINRMGLIYNLKKFSTTFQWNYTAKSFGDANNTIKSDDATIGLIPAYQVFDWSATYHFNNYNFKAGVNNLADLHYFTRRTDEYPGPGIIPSVSRNFYVSFGVKF